MVVYAPTEEAIEGLKVKYMAALNSTVASVPLGNMSSFEQTQTLGQGREVKETGKQTARCRAHMVETCSMKTANYFWV